MAIEPKKETEKPKPLVFRNNPEVKRKIEAHKKANPGDHTYYTRLVKEYPDRAIDNFILRDVQKRENELKLASRQMEGAKLFYDEQPADVKQRIDRALEGVAVEEHDKAFVGAVVREQQRMFRRGLTNPPATRMAA